MQWQSLREINIFTFIQYTMQIQDLLWQGRVLGMDTDHTAADTLTKFLGSESWYAPLRTLL